MPRAFSEQEKLEIREKIMETALELFHERGTKSLNIQELTKRVGISQGSFYNFWKDKESLIIDLLAYRSRQKLNRIEMDFSKSIEDPVQYLANVIYKYSIELTAKADQQMIYQEAFKVFLTKDRSEIDVVEKFYKDFLLDLVDFWRKNNVVDKVDIEGISNAFIGSFVLCSNYKQFEKKYFRKMLRIYISGILQEYIQVK